MEDRLGVGPGGVVAVRDQGRKDPGVRGCPPPDGGDGARRTGPPVPTAARAKRSGGRALNDESRTDRGVVGRLIETLRKAPQDAELWAAVAEVLLRAGHFEKAVRAFDLALQLDPELHRAQIGLAIALDVCDADLSERELPTMRTAVWESLQVLEGLAQGLRERRKSLFVDVQAIRVQKATRRRLAADPNDPDALFLQSALLAKQGALEDAIAILGPLADPQVDYPGAARFREQLLEMAAASGDLTDEK